MEYFNHIDAELTNACPPLAGDSEGSFAKTMNVECFILQRRIDAGNSIQRNMESINCVDVDLTRLKQSKVKIMVSERFMLQRRINMVNSIQISFQKI